MRAKKRFKLNPKKSHLAAQNTLLGRVAVPRVTRLYIRMPNWLGDVVMALPLISAIRKGRPDMRITLIGKAAFKPLFDRFCISDDFIPLPPKGWGYFLDFYKRRLEYPDTFLLFTNSSRGDMEAFFTRCPQRMGMLRPGKKRPLLTDGYDLPDDVDETQIHQTHVWEKMLRSFGLLEALDYSPLPRKPQTDRPQVGLICGSENSPEKRWPISHWRVLVEQLLEVCPEVEILLFGTPMDDAITSEVAKGFAESSVRNLAGKTNLVEFCDALQSARTIVCNDTGGMHLANMFGTPVVAIFGPTNPVRTGPIFEGPTTILQPPGCPKTGGSAIEGVAPESVLAAIQPNLEVRDCE